MAFAVLPLGSAFAYVERTCETLGVHPAWKEVVSLCTHMWISVENWKGSQKSVIQFYAWPCCWDFLTVQRKLVVCFPLWYVVYVFVKLLFHWLLRILELFGEVGLDVFNLLQASLDSQDALARKYNPAICGVLAVILLQQGHSNAHMIDDVIHKLAIGSSASRLSCKSRVECRT